MSATASVTVDQPSSLLPFTTSIMLMTSPSHCNISRQHSQAKLALQKRWTIIGDMNMGKYLGVYWDEA